jgi:AmmeMemoRadiSam system protein A
MSARGALTLLLITGALSGRNASSQDPPPQNPAPEAAPSPAGTPEITPGPPPPAALDCVARPLDASERDTLLRLAWRTLTGHLGNDPIGDADLDVYFLTPCLMAPRGLFVTLKKAGRVRGMQGEIEPARPLYQQVIVFTRRAATRDPRFLPLLDADLGETTIELALIGERTKVGGPAEIRIDSQGVFLEKWGRRALFLPGLAAQEGWTAERTLDELCSQAALPRGSWSESARIEVFGTQVVAGPQPVEPPPPPLPPSPEVSPAPAGRAPIGAARKRAARSTI